MDINNIEILYGIKEMDEKAISLITPPLKKLLNNLLIKHGVYSLSVEELMSWVFAEISCGNIPESLSSTPLAYLRGVGENLILKNYRRNKREILTDSNSIDNFRFPEDTIENDEKFLCKRLRICIEKMSPSCRNLLKSLFTTDDINDLVISLKYNSADTVYSRKNQCIGELKKIISEHDPWLANKLKK